MATKILEFDLRQVPERLSGFSDYSRAFVLLRRGGRPVASVVVPLRSGVLRRADVSEALGRNLNCGLLELWTREVLPLESDHEAPAPAPIRATIAVCTRDRPDDLRRCLESLTRLPDDGQDIIVVDNCPSSESTRHSVNAFPGIRYVRELRRGLNCARNRALREANSEVVAFIDDDAVADENWLRALVEPFSESLTLAVTGLTLPLELETEAQELFEQISGFSRGFRRLRFSIETHSPACGGAAGAGTNMALRKSVLKSVGAFDEALDAGTLTHSGGDSEMFTRILARGFDVIYEPAALNWHRHRRSRRELKQTLLGYGTGLYAGWTRSLLVDKEWDVLRVGAAWFFRAQLRSLARSILKRSGAAPPDLVLAQLWGSILGPFAYARAKRRIPPAAPASA